MFVPMKVRDQLEASADDRIRVLVVGAGVAGITAARLLRAEGLHPVLLERSRPGTNQGYMLALMPLVDPVIEALAVREEYLVRSTALTTYSLRNRHGVPLREYSIGGLLGRFGDYRGIDRGSLLEVLAGDGTPVSHAATVTALRQPSDTVLVTIGSPEGEVEAEFDLVIAADGLSSATRDLLVGAVPGVDTGWGGWIAWTGPGHPADRGEEVWGTGFLVAAYPVKDDTGVIVGGPAEAMRRGPQAFVERVRAGLDRSDGIIGAALDAVAGDPDPYYWALRDRRSPQWSIGRVALLGDAAAGFLPTAGIGACMAMESAGLLADRLRGISGPQVPEALADFERRQRPRVEAAQDNSRALARLMFRDGPVVAAIRDALSRYLPLQVALRPILRLVREQPSLSRR